MSTIAEIGARLASRFRSLFCEDVVPKPTAWLFVAGGIPVVFWEFFTGPPILAGGASQLARIFLGSALAVWGVSELLPSRYQRSIALLRLYAIVGCGIAVFALYFLFVFWWGMQQPP